uniref:Uncharacterized protein n=1 Tax=Cyclophora tenuis TaxID=216820 RepID=A0A7S1CYC0_CYCTE|mmetsp:Transcript_10932/g.18527  ORF Transcript_10932/g.18527 Transcript_10932/m.18527 type:complete len:272 (+) Transcript_10932:517-1332(+)
MGTNTATKRENHVMFLLHQRHFLQVHHSVLAVRKFHHCPWQRPYDRYILTFCKHHKHFQPRFVFAVVATHIDHIRPITYARPVWLFFPDEGLKTIHRTFDVGIPAIVPKVSCQSGIHLLTKSFMTSTNLANKSIALMADAASPKPSSTKTTGYIGAESLQVATPKSSLVGSDALPQDSVFWNSLSPPSTPRTPSPPRTPSTPVLRNGTARYPSPPIIRQHRRVAPLSVPSHLVLPDLAQNVEPVVTFRGISNTGNITMQTRSPCFSLRRDR